jgi:hypothetical protein
MKHAVRAVTAQSVQRWATGWTIGVLGFDFRRGLGIFLFTNASRMALGPTQPPIQWVPGAPSLGGKAAGARSWPSSAEAKECVELYLHSTNTPWRGAQLKKAQGQLYFETRGCTLQVLPFQASSDQAYGTGTACPWLTMTLRLIGLPGRAVLFLSSGRHCTLRIKERCDNSFCPRSTAFYDISFCQTQMTVSWILFTE